MAKKRKTSRKKGRKKPARKKKQSKKKRATRKKSGGRKQPKEQKCTINLNAGMENPVNYVKRNREGVKQEMMLQIMAGCKRVKVNVKHQKKGKERTHRIKIDV